MRKRFVFNRETKTFDEVGAEFKPTINAPFVHQDSMDALSHPADCKMYDSKSTFRRVTKAHGYEERGDAERVADNKPKYRNVSEDDYVAAVKQSWEQLESGTAPLNEYEREKCKRINEHLRNR